MSMSLRQEIEVGPDSGRNQSWAFIDDMNQDNLR